MTTATGGAGGEIPVWVSGQQLWVRGVDRKTTCNDVITALLGRQEDGYVIVERWRRVERPLGGDTRLLKLWTTWGDARDEVKLSLRRVSDDDSGRGSPSAVSRRRKHHHHHHRQKKDTQTVHPKRLAQLSKTQSIERLLKLILVQGETIQSQLQRLHDREDQIEQLEDETHKARVSVLGSDYVLQTYLGGDASTPSTSRKTHHHEDEKENDSGVVTEGTPTGENACTPTEDPAKDDDDPTIEEDIEAEIQDLQKRIELWEKVLKVNKKLEKEEENLVRLYVNFKRCGEMESLQNELDQKQQQLERGARQLEINNCSLLEADSALEARRRYLRVLQSELDASDQETERLLKASDPRNVHHTRLKYSRDFDSNSDTGLSSLHSSSEEGTYVLDTLV